MASSVNCLISRLVSTVWCVILQIEMACFKNENCAYELFKLSGWNKKVFQKSFHLFLWWLWEFLSKKFCFVGMIIIISPWFCQLSVITYNFLKVSSSVSLAIIFHMYFQFNNWIPAAKTNWMWNIYRRCENKKCFLLQFNIDRNFDAFHRLRQSTFFKDIGRQISIEFRNVLSLVSHIVFAKKTWYVLHASTMWTIKLCHLLKVMGIR